MKCHLIDFIRYMCIFLFYSLQVGMVIEDQRDHEEALEPQVRQAHWENQGLRAHRDHRDCVVSRAAQEAPEEPVAQVCPDRLDPEENQDPMDCLDPPV